MWSHLLHKTLLIFLFAIPAYAYAGISITEIMYDPSGGDDGREWIEIYNSGQDTDISKWKLFEGGTNHGLTAYSGGNVLRSNSYAIIADNPQKFLTDWPSYAGQLFDTAFSGGLNNTNGETLTLRNDALMDVDTVTYSPTWGASGDGNSLQKSGASFISFAPTPGNGNNYVDTTSPTSPPPSTESTEQQAVSNMSYPVEPQIKVNAGQSRTVIAGATTVFDARVTGITGERLESARVVWNFGNGDRKEGLSVLYVYPYPGKYAVVVDASSSYFSATSRLVVTVVPADITISRVTEEVIEITNRSSLELDLGMWQISADGKIFQFPQHTIIFPKEKVTISNTATGIVPTSPGAVSLLFPNGMLAVKYGQDLVQSRLPLGSDTQDRTTLITSRALAKEGSGNLAAVGAAIATSTEPLLAFKMDAWFIGLLAVIILGIAGVLLLPPKRGSATGYRIIEEDSD